jgi:hypothetical protein
MKFENRSELPALTVAIFVCPKFLIFLDSKNFHRQSNGEAMESKKKLSHCPETFLKIPQHFIRVHESVCLISYQEIILFVFFAENLFVLDLIPLS